MGNEARTDEELEAVHLQPIQVLNGPIFLAPYDPEWPLLFEREARRIRAALGAAALMVEHVGSTSVPGLSAKPKIDIDLVVADSSAEDAYGPALEAAAYVLRIREAGWHQHRLFKGPDTDINLHTFTLGCVEIERMLSFRDHLREDVPDRQLYERTKQELSARTWKYTQHYADAKSAVVEAILSRCALASAACVRS